MQQQQPADSCAKLSILSDRTHNRMGTPQSPPSQVPPGMEGFVIGLIGMGDMGKMYARRLSSAGWR